jgi:hypothetical protein
LEPNSSLEGAILATATRSHDIQGELAYYNSFLNKLLGLISHGEEESVARVITVIRSGASIEQILDVIDQIPRGSCQ